MARFTDINEAKKFCDNLICQHVATWREGEENWAYRDDPVANTDKVSLDPYRLESRKILSVIKDTLPAGVQKVEKASIDEVVGYLLDHPLHSESSLGLTRLSSSTCQLKSTTFF